MFDLSHFFNTDLYFCSAFAAAIDINCQVSTLTAKTLGTLNFSTFASVHFNLCLLHFFGPDINHLQRILILLLMYAILYNMN